MVCDNAVDPFTQQSLEGVPQHRLTVLNRDGLPARVPGSSRWCFLTKPLFRFVRRQHVMGTAPRNPLTNTPLSAGTLRHIEERYRVLKNTPDSDTESEDGDVVHDDEDLRAMGRYAVRILMRTILDLPLLSRWVHHDLEWTDETRGAVRSTTPHSPNVLSTTARYLIDTESRRSTRHVSVEFRLNYSQRRPFVVNVYNPLEQFIMSDGEMRRALLMKLAQVAPGLIPRPSRMSRGGGRG
jgi:hypothetical protein